MFEYRQRSQQVHLISVESSRLGGICHPSFNPDTQVPSARSIVLILFQIVEKLDETQFAGLMAGVVVEAGFE